MKNPLGFPGYFCGILKLDLLTGDVVRRFYRTAQSDAQGWGCESVFAPNTQHEAGGGGGIGREEDDGWIVSFVHDESSEQTELQILSARTLELTAALAVGCQCLQVTPPCFNASVCTSHPY